MSILRSFVHWYVWWGRNALYYYSRPFTWAVKWVVVPPGALPLAHPRQRHAAENLRAEVRAFQRDVIAAEREYTEALQRHHEEEQLCGTKLEVRMLFKEAQQNILDAKREAGR